MLLCTSATAREQITFWHLWGGRDRPIVERIVRRFNDSQDQYTVRPIAMPGSNLDLKFFLSVAGGDPPDLLSHDDPVVADWAHRGVLTPLDKLASPDEYRRLNQWLFPAARQLGTYNSRLYALPSGLDIRALYCNQTLLAEHGLKLPRTTDDLDRIAERIAPSSGPVGRKRMGYLPDPRRLWAWGIVFGGRFWNPDATDPDQQITGDSPEIVRALQWMAGYSRRYGPSEMAAFRSGEQALTGATFPLLVDRRYAVIMDGQWRVRDIAEAARRGSPTDKYAVVPLPMPEGGVANAGWVNGNFFVVPSQARHKKGAWAFMQFWSGFNGHEAEAATACAAGGWIPASQKVVDQPAYQQLLTNQPHLKTFVQLARSEQQTPVPSLPISAYYVQQINRAAEEVLYRGADPARSLQQACARARTRLKEVRHVP